MRRSGVLLLSSFQFLSACILKKKSDSVVQLSSDAGVSVPSENAKEIGVSDDFVNLVYSKENLMKAEVQRAPGRSLELNLLLKSDWQRRLPIKVKNGSVKKFEDVESQEDIVGLGDMTVRNLKVNFAATDTLRRLAVDRQVPQFQVVKIETSRDSLLELIAALNYIHQLPSVLFAEPNYKVQKIATPNDPSFPSLWGMAKISAPSAWNSVTGNSSVTVAVIDTGIDLNHVDLKDNLWKNTKEIPGNGIDDDGNGYIDDINGWDFAQGDNDPMDGDGHGTHCAGTIAARGNNGIGVVGVNWNARLMPVKVLDDSGSGFNYDIYNGIMYAIANGARVTSNSYGGGGASSLLATALKAAQDAGVLFVAAAGNESASKASYPAYYTKTYPNILSVASTETNDSLSSFSNYGDGVDVAAPGRNILSTAPSNGYQTLSGTSMAAPHVAGVATLLWSAAPTKSLAEIRSAIVSKSDAVPALAGRVAANGRINVKASLDALAVGPIPGPTPTVLPSPPPSPTPTPNTPTPTPSVTPKPTVTAAPVTPTPTLPSPTPSPTPQPPSGMTDGLQFRVYRGFWFSLPNFDSLTPVAEGVSLSPSLSGVNFSYQFGAVFEGQIWIPNPGSYTFYLKSDDGSSLALDGEKLIANDGIHGPREKSGSRFLTRGFHSIRLDYFQLFGQRSLSLSWEGPGMTRQKIAEKGALFHRSKP